MSRKAVTLDVRDDIRNGREPFSRIMQAVAGLAENQDLRLLAPFEPKPLYGVLAGYGFTHQCRPLPDGDFEVLFARQQGVAEPSAPSGSDAPQPCGSACEGSPVLDLDARGLEPPQPMVTILEAVASLPAGVKLRARTDRRPMHLYAQLEQRGFTGTSEEQADGSFVTLIERARNAGGCS